uniref:Uncharacterized protein n=1 Tax=Panagrolaimus sp. ES5 TaxID=591445 RepID=A0AC34GA08_9BILA
MFSKCFHCHKLSFQSNSKFLRKIAFDRLSQSYERFKFYKSDEIECSAIFYYKGGEQHTDVCIAFSLDKNPRDRILHGSFKYQIVVERPGNPYKSEVKTCSWNYDDSAFIESNHFVVMPRKKMAQLFEGGAKPKIVIFDASFEKGEHLAYIPRNVPDDPTPYTLSVLSEFFKTDGIHRRSGICRCDGNFFYMNIEYKKPNFNLYFVLLNPPRDGSITGKMYVWIEDRKHEKTEIPVDFTSANRSTAFRHMLAKDFQNLFGKYRTQVELKFEAEFN